MTCWQMQPPQTLAGTRVYTCSWQGGPAGNLRRHQGKGWGQQGSEALAGRAVQAIQRLLDVGPAVRRDGFELRASAACEAQQGSTAGSGREAGTSMQGQEQAAALDRAAHDPAGNRCHEGRIPQGLQAAQGLKQQGPARLRRRARCHHQPSRLYMSEPGCELDEGRLLL